MTDRSDDAIRSDLAKLQKPATGYHDVRIALDQARLARERLAADVAPLLARAVAAEARAEKAEATIARQLGDCTGCTTEPEETCPRDGRSYTEWVNIASEVSGRHNDLAAERDNFERLATERYHEAREARARVAELEGENERLRELGTIAQQIHRAEQVISDSAAALPEALAADDYTEPDEDGDRCERLLYPRAVRAALAAAAPPREDER